MDGLIPFDVESRNRIVFGEGAVDRVGTFAAATGARHVFLVTDPGIVAAVDSAEELAARFSQ